MDMPSKFTETAVRALKTFIGLSLTLLSTISLSAHAVNYQEFTPQTILSTVMPGP